MKITALTSFCVDIFPEQGKTYIGGNSLNFATHCQLSGVSEVQVIGGTGRDQGGQLIRKHLHDLSIDCARLYELDEPTASNQIFIDAQGDRYFKADSWNGGAFDAFRLSEEDWASISDSSLIAMPAGDPNLPQLVQKRTEQQVIVVDFLDYLGPDFMEQYLPGIDIAMISGKLEDVDRYQQLSAKYDKTIIATFGADGSVAFDGARRYDQEAIPVTEVVDTTGCGDAFLASYCMEWMHGKDIQKSLYAGAVAASKVLTYVGGVP